MNRRSPNKFSAVRTVVDGIKFDSKMEARRYSELKLLERAGVIKGLRPHPRFALLVNHELIGHYTPDSSYIEGKTYTVEDVKSRPTRTTDYVLRSKLFRALYPHIRFVEIGVTGRPAPEAASP